MWDNVEGGQLDRVKEEEGREVGIFALVDAKKIASDVEKRIR